jgi:MFS family permease
VVLAGRVLDRFGKGIRSAPRDALIAESLHESDRGKAFGLHRAMDTAGAAAGVLLAYLFLTARFEIGTVILWSLVPASLGVLLLLLVREQRRGARTDHPLPPLRWSALPPKLRRLLAIVLLFNLGNSSNAFLLLRAQDVGFTPSGALLLYLLYNLSFAALSLPAGKLSDRISRTKVLSLGYGLYGLAYLGFALTGQGMPHLAFGLLFALYGAYSALTEGVERALVSDLASAETRATALGMHAALTGVGLLPASIIAGALWESVGPWSVFALGASLSAGAAGALKAFR